MTKIISFVNQKGGVGKTTSVINISASLAHTFNKNKKNKILMLDMDPQANTSQIYTSTTDGDLSIYNLLVDEHQTKEKNKEIDMKTLIQTTYIENLDIIPSNVLLSSAEIELVNIHGRETILKRILKNNKDFLSKYDYIIIDCQPSLGLLTINSIIAADYLMVPIHADVFSLTGLQLLSETIEKLQSIFEINTTILGFFFTQVNQQETLFKEAFELCKNSYPNLLFNQFIRNNTAIDHANATDQSVIHFAPNASSSKDYKQLTKEFLSKISQ